MYHDVLFQLFLLIWYNEIHHGWMLTHEGKIYVEDLSTSVMDLGRIVSWWLKSIFGEDCVFYGIGACALQVIDASYIRKIGEHGVTQNN